VVTEAGFGADLGAEKFLDIKCVSGELMPKALVLVATIRALRHHGGATKEQYNDASTERVEKGFDNLAKHIENCKTFGLNPVVAINAFPSDSAEEVSLIQKKCAAMGVKAIVAEGFAKGGEGMTNLAQAVVEEIDNGNNNFTPLYDWKLPIKEKIEIIAKKIYGADGVEYSKKALTDLRKIENLGMNELPICMAKTQKSFSDNESLIGRPTGFTISVREFEFASGAGFIIPILGNMMRMPGLPAVPASEGMFIDNNGKISGLS
jgi:formate--tetrahydrofolate ligase